MRSSSRLLFVGAVTSVLVLTGCADDDVQLADADLLDEGDLDDIDRGALLLDETADPDEVLYSGEAVSQCIDEPDEEQPTSARQARVDLAGEGSLVVTFDADADDLLDVDLITEPGAPAIAWDGAGAAAWDVRDDVLVGEVEVVRTDGDDTPGRVVRFAVDWDDDVEDCLDVSEPVEELAGQGSWYEVPGARIDATDVCEEETEDGIRWTMILENGSVLTVTGDDDEDVTATLDVADGGERDLTMTGVVGVEADDGDIEGTFTTTAEGSTETVEGTFRIDREAALECGG
jgi:hypothetical protein